MGIVGKINKVSIPPVAVGEAAGIIVSYEATAYNIEPGQRWQTSLYAEADHRPYIIVNNHYGSRKVVFTYEALYFGAMPSRILEGEVLLQVRVVVDPLRDLWKIIDTWSFTISADPAVGSKVQKKTNGFPLGLVITGILVLVGLSKAKTRGD